MSEKRKYTYNLTNFNLANDALLRASQLASVYDMVAEAEQAELEKALNGEMQLARRLMDMVKFKDADEVVTAPAPIPTATAPEDIIARLHKRATTR